MSTVYEKIRRNYPSVISGEQLCKICRISNINQIARKINAGIGTESDVRETLFLLSKVYQLMEQVAER